MQKVLFLTNIPSPYRVEFFNELGKRCELTVIFERHSSAERDSSWNDFQSNHFKAIFLTGLAFRTDSSICPSIIKYLKKDQFDHIVVTNLCDPTGILAIAYMRAHRIPYEIEGDGGFAKNGEGFREKLKHWLISGASRWFSTAKAHDQYYLQYGAKKENIVRYPFTSLHENDILTEVPSQKKKYELRQKLGINERHIVLSIGQFIKRKGFDLLICASDGLFEDTGIYIIGGKPTQEYLNLRTRYRSEKIHFVEFKQKDELKEYYQAADIFILPTREDIWGLVINEAMANGLPVVTTDKCVAGLELVDERNGALIPSESIEEIYNSINRILSCDEVRNAMCSTSLKRIKNYTFENMAKLHLDVWENECMK